MTKASDNDYPSILLTEQGSAPSSPAASHQRLYVRTSDHVLVLVNSSGTVSAVGAAGGVTHTTLGTTSPGASFATRGMYIKKVTLASAGLLSAIWAHMKADGTNGSTITAVVYSNSGGNPINVMLSSGIVTRSTVLNVQLALLNTTARWLAFPVGAWLAAGDYWIGVWFTDGTGSATSLAYSSGTGSDRTVAGGTNNLPQDSSVQAISTGTNDYSIYADILR
jgi:hypothetical protein